MKHIVIELPQFLNMNSQQALGYPMRDVDLKCIRKLLSKGDRVRDQNMELKSLSDLALKGHFNPLWGAKYHGLEYAGDDGYCWFRADPMELQPDRIAVYLNGNLHLKMNEKEKLLLEKEINSLAKDSDFKFFCISEKEGYIRVRNHHHVKFTALYDAIGKDQIQTFPSGADALFWKQLLTEIQMQLHTSAINTEHTRKGTGLINSLYFWGDCQHQLCEINANAIYSQSNILKSLAHEKGIAFEEFPDNWQLDKIKSGNHYFIDCELIWSAKQGLVSRWLDRLCVLERKLIKPVYKSLKKGEIESLTIISEKGVQYRFTKKNRLKIWRQIKNIDYFIE